MNRNELNAALDQLVYTYGLLRDAVHGENIEKLVEQIERQREKILSALTTKEKTGDE